MHHPLTHQSSSTDNQQLRSPSARRFLSQPAPKCMLAGTTIVALLVMLLMLALRMMHYPMTSDAEPAPAPTLWQLIFHDQ